MLGPMRTRLVTLLSLLCSVVAVDTDVVAAAGARKNIHETRHKSLSDLPTFFSVERIFPFFRNNRVNFTRNRESFPDKFNDSFIFSTRALPSTGKTHVNLGLAGISNITDKNSSFLNTKRLDQFRSLKLVPQLPIFSYQPVNPKSKLLTMFRETKQLQQKVDRRAQNSRYRAIQPHSTPAKSHRRNTRKRPVRKTRPPKKNRHQVVNSMDIYTIFNDTKYLEEEEIIEPQTENNLIDLLTSLEKLSAEEESEYFSDVPVTLSFTASEQRELDISLLSRVQDLFSELLDTNSSLPMRAHKQRQVKEHSAETQVEPSPPENFLTKLMSHFTNWNWKPHGENITGVKIESEKESDPYGDDVIARMKEELLEKLEPVIADTFGHPHMNGSELMGILENPFSIKHQLLSRTSEEHARELTDIFSSYEGLDYTQFMDKVVNANDSLMTDILGNVGAEVKSSLYEMLNNTYREERSDNDATENRSYSSTDVVQPKNINISFAITTSPKNSSFFSGHNLFNLSSSYFNFSKNALNYTHSPTLYGIHLAALPILATLTTGALFGLGGVLAILIASHYHHGGKKDYDYDEEYGYSTGYHSSPLVIAIPHGDNKGGYGSHSTNVKVARPKSVRGKIKKASRVRPHRGSTHRPHKHGGGGGGGGGYPHHRHEDEKSYFYEDDYHIGRTLEEIDWKYSKESNSPRYVRLRSKEISKTSPVIDSSRLFGTSFEAKKPQPGEFKWIYGSTEARDKRKDIIYSSELFGRSSEISQHNKRDIFESWEKGRKSLYKPLKDTGSRTSSRRRTPTRKGDNITPYRGTLVLQDSGLLEDIFYEKNDGRRTSSSKGKRKSWRSRDNVGQSSSYDGTRASLDGGSPLSGVGNIPGIEWTLEPMSEEKGSGAVKDLVIMSDNPLDKRWRPRDTEEEMFKADSTLDARRKLNALLDRYRQYTRDVFIDGDDATFPIAQPLAAQPPETASDSVTGAVQGTPESTQSFQRRFLRLDSAEKRLGVTQSPQVNFPMTHQRLVDSQSFPQPVRPTPTSATHKTQQLSSKHEALNSSSSRVLQTNQPYLPSIQSTRNFAQFSGD